VNDLRRALIWVSILAALAIGIWGFQWHEEAMARPFAPEYRWFRATHRVELYGRPFHLPWRRMLCGWGAVACAVAGLWPFATTERSRRLFGRWEAGSAARSGGDPA
jgi:hypothetical protein